MQRSGELLNIALDHIIQGVVMYDSDRRLVVWNDHFQEVLRFPEGYLEAGQSIMDLALFLAERGDYGRGDARVLARDRVELLWAGTAQRTEVKIRSAKTYEVLSQPTKNSGLVITYTDITERIQAQQEIARQRDQLELLNQQKNKFFSIVAHDLKNPFNVMIGYADMIDRMGDDMPKEKLLEILHTMSSSSRNLYQLLEELLAWGQSQMNLTRLDPKPVGIIDLFNRAIGNLRDEAERKRVTLNLETDEPKAVLDADLISVVIRNLVSNAIKYTPEEGDVLVSSQRRKNQTGSEELEVSVRDSGIGIDRENLDQLFRIDRNTTTPGTGGEGGTGLGLILCKEFVERHGGKISADSTVGEGTTIRFTLPANPDIPVAVN
jgi:signal transduction histidine kinase